MRVSLQVARSTQRCCDPFVLGFQGLLVLFPPFLSNLHEVKALDRSAYRIGVTGHYRHTRTQVRASRPAGVICKA